MNVNNKPKALFVVTGQLRNCTDNIENWKSAIIQNYDAHFLFVIWDQLGGVEPSKIHLRNLKSKRMMKVDWLHVSLNHTYYKKSKMFISEIDKLKTKLGPNVTIKVVKYSDSFLEQVDGVIIPDAVKCEDNPWWKGYLPVAYINHIAAQEIRSKHTYGDIDIYFRLQSELNFMQPVESAHDINDNEIITSPDTINPKHQVSIKFFGGRKHAFLHLLDAFEDLRTVASKEIDKNEPALFPVGERHLKQLANKHNLGIRYVVRTKVNREIYRPCLPFWFPKFIVNKIWVSPRIITH